MYKISWKDCRLINDLNLLVGTDYMNESVFHILKSVRLHY
jgi:hypothetical protein